MTVKTGNWSSSQTTSGTTCPVYSVCDIRSHDASNPLPCEQWFLLGGSAWQAHEKYMGREKERAECGGLRRLRPVEKLLLAGYKSVYSK